MERVLIALLTIFLGGLVGGILHAHIHQLSQLLRHQRHIIVACWQLAKHQHLCFGDCHE